MKPRYQGHVRALLLVVGSALAAVPSSFARAVSAAEQDYFVARDAYVRHFEAGPADDDQSKAKEDLTRRMRAIVGPIKVQGFIGKGQGSPGSLASGYIGFGDVDGLRFNSGHRTLFVVTPAVLGRWLESRPALPKSLARLAADEEFYLRSIGGDAHITLFSEVPLPAAGATVVTRAWLALAAQDDGPFMPNTLIVFASTPLRVFVLAERVTAAPLAPCQRIWNNNYLDGQGSEERALKAYRDCVLRGAPRQPFFSSLRARAGELARSLISHP